MGKKVRVSLHGFQNRGIMVDASATEGATVGKNLRWSDGSLVTEEELRSITGQSVSNGTTIDQNLLNYILANLGSGGSGDGYPLIRDTIETSLSIPNEHQYHVWGEVTVALGITLTVEAGGELIIFDRELADLKGPDFTYDVGGDLTQIDYDDGSQKVFTYNGSGDLQYVDLTRDGWTLRKEFVYSGDELDYVDEYYV